MHHPDQSLRPDDGRVGGGQSNRSAGDPRVYCGLHFLYCGGEEPGGLREALGSSGCGRRVAVEPVGGSAGGRRAVGGRLAGGRRAVGERLAGGQQNNHKAATVQPQNGHRA